MAQSKFRTHKRKGEKQELEVNPRVVVGREEYRQWQYLRSKNINISQKRFENYLLSVKKANAKLSRAEKDPNYLGLYSRVSDNVKYMESIDDFEYAEERLNQINGEDFVEDITKENVDRLQRNVDEVFGDSVDFRNLTPKQIKEFFSDFPELKSLLYYPDKEGVETTLDLIGKTKTAIVDAINYIKGKK